MPGLSPEEGETVQSPTVPDIIGSPAAHEEITQSVADLRMHCTPDTTIEETINELADKLAAFCFQHLEEDVCSGDGNNVIDHAAFAEELQVRYSKVISQ